MVGVIARDVNDRHYIRINAPKGVILATGGYGNNLEMMEARQPWNQKMRISIGRNGTGGNPTGDGIKAALWVGGQMDPIGAACMFNRAAVKPDEKAGDGIVGEWYWFGEQPFMKVNLNGKRFCNESGPYDYMLHSTVMQPGHTYCDIFDSDYVEQAKQMNEVGCCRLYPFDNGSPSNMSINLMPKMFFDPLLEKGYLQKADTPEELAKAFHVARQLDMKGGMLVTNPIPEEYSMDHKVIDAAIEQALADAKAQGIHGKETTPFLLARVKDLTGGDSLDSNIQLVYNNARLAARTACALQTLEQA